MDLQRLMAALAHSSITIQQALTSPLVSPDQNKRRCKRLDCGQWFEKNGNHLYCNDPECRYQRNLERSRRGNDRKKARGAA